MESCGYIDAAKEAVGTTMSGVTAGGVYVIWHGGLRIPTQGGQVFRSDPGHCSDLMAATIPI